MQPLRGEKEEVFDGTQEGGGDEGEEGRVSETMGDKETGLLPDWVRTCKTMKKLCSIGTSRQVFSSRCFAQFLRRTFLRSKEEHLKV